MEIALSHFLNPGVRVDRIPTSQARIVFQFSMCHRLVLSLANVAEYDSSLAFPDYAEAE